MAQDQLPSTPSKRLSPLLAVLLLPTLWFRRRVRKLSPLLCLWIIPLLIGCGDLIAPGTPRAVISVIGTATSPTGASITHTALVTLTLTLQ